MFSPCVHALGFLLVLQISPTAQRNTDVSLHLNLVAQCMLGWAQALQILTDLEYGRM